MQCGLLGQKLSHSFSPQIHAHLANYDYSLFEIEPNHLEAFLKNEQFSGLNVTMPYKKAVMPFCTKLSEQAKMLGAVNTIVRLDDGSLYGDNTDFSGFCSMLLRSGLQVHGKKVLVLGSGGASVTVTTVLRQAGAKVVVISRTGADNYDNISNHTDAYAIVNATPVGMYPNTMSAPVDLDFFPDLTGVLDLIYNPARTKLLMDAQNRGIISENGLWMLIAQAKESAELFSGSKISDNVIAHIFTKLRFQTDNIILIGMPGCGKSTVGKLLAKKTGKQFYDADAAVAEAVGLSVPEFFLSNGEAAFRKEETKVLAELGKMSGCVIATGGGCVTQPENYPLLHQNGTIIWIKRSVNQLSVKGRPLSMKNGPEALYEERKGFYEKFSDMSVDNNESPEETVDNIMRMLDPEDE